MTATIRAIGSVCVARDLSEIKKVLDDLATVNQRLQHEVSERKQMEAALQEANLSLQEVLAQVEERNHTMTQANEMGGFAAILPGFRRSL